MIVFTDESASLARRAIERREAAFAIGRVEEMPAHANPPAAGEPNYEPEIRYPVDWWEVAGTLTAALIVAAFWGAIIWRVARGGWPWH